MRNQRMNFMQIKVLGMEKGHNAKCAATFLVKNGAKAIRIGLEKIQGLGVRKDGQ